MPCKCGKYNIEETLKFNDITQRGTINPYRF